MGKITVQLNGDALTMSPCTLLELIELNGVDPMMVIVEYNHEILDRNSYNATMLESGDVVEIIRYVGGGGLFVLS